MASLQNRLVSWRYCWGLSGAHSLGVFCAFHNSPHDLSWLQAWIEASTKGAVLVFTASEVETATLAAGISPAFAGLLGGMTGGVAQAYATMGRSSP